MGAAQASDLLEPLRIGRRVPRPVIPRLPRLRLGGLPGRELTIAKASFVLMASFLVSALLASVRPVLFNADFSVSVRERALRGLSPAGHAVQPQRGRRAAERDDPGALDVHPPGGGAGWWVASECGAHHAGGVRRARGGRRRAGDARV